MLEHPGQPDLMDGNPNNDSGVGMRLYLSSLPTQAILRFHDSIILLLIDGIRIDRLGETLYLFLFMFHDMETG